MKDLYRYIVNESSTWGNLSPEDDKKYSELEDKYMPASGKADNVGGEIIRAMSRLVYRFYNDGDTVAHYGGSSFNLLFGAEQYLMNHVKGYKSMDFITDDKKYEDLLCKNLKTVLDFLLSNEDIFKKKNNESFIDLGREEEQNWDDDDY